MTAPTKNLLTHARFFKLCVWLDPAKLTGLTPASAADLATAAMGFRVTPKNLVSAREASGVKFWLKGEHKDKPQGDATPNERLLAREVYGLLNALGLPACQELLDLLGSARKYPQPGDTFPE